MTYLLLQDYERQLECQYKGETYSVRDNGAVLRHPKNDDKPRPSDNKWTFGKYDDKTGYAKIAGESVHRIVATAFHGEPPSSQYVVDHIDTKGFIFKAFCVFSNCLHGRLKKETVNLSIKNAILCLRVVHALGA